MKTWMLALLGAGTIVAADARAGAPATSLVTNGSFETPAIGGGFVGIGGGYNMNGWVVVNNLDLIQNFWAAAEGLQSLDLNGSSAGGVTQSFTSVPGTKYLVRYAVSENFYGYSDKTMDILWNGAVVKSETIAHNPARTPTNMLWEYRQIVVTATTANSTLEFLSTTGPMNGSQGIAPYYGPALDDVTVTVAPPPCPWDINGDHTVNTFDLAILLGHFGQSVPNGTLGDINGDGVVNTIDLGALVSHFGVPCP